MVSDWLTVTESSTPCPHLPRITVPIYRHDPPELASTDLIRQNREFHPEQEMSSMFFLKLLMGTSAKITASREAGRRNNVISEMSGDERGSQKKKPPPGIMSKTPKIRHGMR